MANPKQKLEFTWIRLRLPGNGCRGFGQGYGEQVGMDKQPQLEPRILIEDAGKSYGGRGNVPNALIALLAFFQKHLNMLSKLSQVFQPAFIETLLSSSSPEAACVLIQKAA